MQSIQGKLVCTSTSAGQQRLTTPNTSSNPGPLAGHPDQAFARYVVRGIRSKFRIGLKWGTPLRSASANHGVSPSKSREYLQKELSLGHMLGPFTDTSSLPPLHINRFGVIPKGHNTGKWRLLTDLLYSHGHSVNEGIDSTLCSLQYTTVDQMARVVAYLGTGAMLAKVDIESEYRLIPVHPQDRPLQAMPIRGEYLYRPHTPIQSPKIFNAVTDALIWHLHQTGIPHVEHYLDDYFIAGLPNSKQCQESLGVLNRECNTLGVRAAAH